MDHDTAYEIRRDRIMSERLDAGQPTRSARTPLEPTGFMKRVQVRKQQTSQPHGHTVPKTNNRSKT